MVDNKSQRLTEHERLESPRPSKIKICLIPRTLPGIYPPSKLATKGSKHKKRKDLEGQTRNHDMLTIQCPLTAIRRSSNTTSNSLKHETEKIAGTKDDSVSPRFES